MNYLLKKIIPVFLFFIVVESAFAEKYPYSKWTQADKDKANTAINAAFLTAQERDVIYYCNLARLNGKLFAETYLQQYVDDNKLKKDKYLNSLLIELPKVKNREMLAPQKDLYNCALDIAKTNGTSGSIGHQRYAARFKKHAPRYGATAENADYGNNKALDIVMSLLIDVDVPSYGHRKNILNNSFKSVGVCIYTHKKYKHQCVMDFGDKK